MSTTYRTKDGETFSSKWEAEQRAENIARAEAMQRKWDAEERAEKQAEKRRKINAWWASLSHEEKRLYNIFSGIVTAVMAIGIVIVVFFVFPAPSNAALSKAFGFLGMKSLSENTAMISIRNSKPRNAIVEEISDETLATNKAAIIEFLESGESYRMDGVVRYAVGSSSDNKRLYAKFDMWFNNETGVMKYYFKQFYNREDPRLQNIFGSDHSRPFRYDKRTYYVMRVNNQTLLFRETEDKEREVFRFNRGDFLFDFMNAKQIHNIVNTDFLNNPETKRFHYRGGDFYQLRSTTRTNTILSQYFGSELRTFNNQPVYFYTSGINKDGVEYEFKVNFYYNKISNYTPSVEKWGK